MSLVLHQSRNVTTCHVKKYIISLFKSHQFESHKLQGHWSFIWLLTLGSVGLVEVHTSWPGYSC